MNNDNNNSNNTINISLLNLCKHENGNCHVVSIISKYVISIKIN